MRSSRQGSRSPPPTPQRYLPPQRSRPRHPRGSLQGGRQPEGSPNLHPSLPAPGSDPDPFELRERTSEDLEKRTTTRSLHERQRWISVLARRHDIVPLRPRIFCVLGRRPAIDSRRELLDLACEAPGTLQDLLKM